MEYFYSDGGNNRPSFAYSFILKDLTTEMWEWCERYPETGYFQRWHVIYNFGPATNGDSKETPLIQFESRKAAYLFSIAYSEYIIENKSIYEIDRP